MATMNSLALIDKKLEFAQPIKQPTAIDLAHQGAQKVAREGGTWARRAARLNSQEVQTARFNQANALALPKMGGAKA